MTEETNNDQIIELLSSDVSAAGNEKKKKILRKLALAALGSIPWVGGFMSTMATLHDDFAQQKTDNLQKQWLEEHAKKIKELADTLSEILGRLESLGDEIETRLESEEYLTLVRQSFRKWDQADTTEKKDLIKNLLTNSGATRLCSDDVVRLFLDWIELYHEIHFAVIKEVYQNPGTTRYDIWARIHGDFPAENSAEADLFRMLVRDLSMGGVIRQARETNDRGEFIKKKNTRGTGSSGVMKSAFDSEESYELTELGKQFVHYTMNEVVTRLGE